MTYDDFDKLIENIDKIGLPEDYVFPTIEEAQDMIASVAGVGLILLAAEKTDDKEYAKELNDLIKDHVEFVEEDELVEDDDPDFKVSKDKKSRIKKINRKLDAMNYSFQSLTFSPTKDEIDNIFKNTNLEEDDAGLAFLIYVTRAGADANATSSMKKISSYVKKSLKEANLI